MDCGSDPNELGQNVRDHSQQKMIYVSLSGSDILFPYNRGDIFTFI